MCRSALADNACELDVFTKRLDSRLPTSSQHSMQGALHRIRLASDRTCKTLPPPSRHDQVVSQLL